MVQQLRRLALAMRSIACSGFYIHSPLCCTGCWFNAAVAGISMSFAAVDCLTHRHSSSAIATKPGSFVFLNLVMSL